MIRNEVQKILPLVQKPGRYIGGELNSVVKKKEDVSLRYCFCFPDSYEIGMSHLGIKILYSQANSREDVWCERAFAPWDDMEDEMRKRSLPLYALESGDPLGNFDLIGFTLQYELSYTNILNMLDLAGIPVRSEDRHSLTPIVIGGGPCACNPEPLAPFFDLFSLGDGEEVSNEVFDLLIECKRENATKEEFLRRASKIRGIYVPSLYDVSYNADGTIRAVEPKDGAAERVQKCVIGDLDTVHYPEKFIVPFTEVVHDRVTHEIMRGCIRGCRFCQAGFLYRPIRVKKADTVNEQCQKLIHSTGYDEISLSSLSTSDYPHLEELIDKLFDWTIDEKINIALPSLRIDNFSPSLMEKLQKVRRSGLTFAPEAGTQRLRDAINKNITEDEILSTSVHAFRGGWTGVKLYFMIGLPTETLDDVAGIANLGQKVVDAFYRMPDKPKGKGVQVSLSVSSFVPKPFTPFQWEAQDTREELAEKQKFLLENIHTKKISCSYHDTRISFLEGVFARGDRKLAGVIESAWRKGCKFDAWDESLKFEAWLEAFDEEGIDPLFYSSRKREYDEILPWDHLDFGISKEFLKRENEKSKKDETTPHCRIQCAGCGANKLNGGECDARRQDLVH